VTLAALGFHPQRVGVVALALPLLTKTAPQEHRQVLPALVWVGLVVVVVVTLKTKPILELLAMVAAPVGSMPLALREPLIRVVAVAVVVIVLSRVLLAALAVPVS
jgi:hypothetical protein